MGHLGLVVSVLGRIRLAETVDHLLGPARGNPGRILILRTFSYSFVCYLISTPPRPLPR